MISLTGYSVLQTTNRGHMIPEKLLQDARAEYRGNVYQFISLGERKKLGRVDYIHIKQKYLDVQDWFEHLDYMLVYSC